MDLSTIRELFAIPIKSATVAPLGIFCLDGHFCGFQALHLGSTIICFSPLAVCITPSSTLRTGSQGRGLQVSPSSILFSPEPKTFCVFKLGFYFQVLRGDQGLW